MTYTCEDCGFVFERVGEVRGCPFCEQKHIRPATQEEIKRLNDKILAANNKTLRRYTSI